MRTLRQIQRVLLLILPLLIGASAEAQQLIPTRGKEFWFGFMQNYGGGAAQHLTVYVSSDVNTNGVMSSPLIGWTQPFSVTANSITTLEVPIANMHMGSEVIDNKSVLIETEDTVAVYALNFESATADAAVIYPTKSLGTNYRVQAYYGLDGFGTLNSEMLIVATADGTEIEIVPKCNTLSGQPANVPFNITLNQGESYQVQAATGAEDLTGTTVISSTASGACRPFAVFSGSVCPDVPTGCFACDHVFDQNLPTPFWGTNYYAVPWQDSNGYTYRVLANEDNTAVTVDTDPPVMLNAGQYIEVNGTATPHCITGDRPISVAQFMQGSDCSGGNSDPAMLILGAEEQKINDITFAAVISNAITAQYVNVVVNTSDVGTVVLDGNTVPTVQFTAFPVCSDRSYARLSLDQGSHRITCPNGLTGYVYGTGPNYETYAYSVGSFTPLPALNYDTVFCGLDTSDVVTLSPPEPVFNPVWTVESNPDDTLSQSLVYTFQPGASDVYVLTGTENVSGCTQQYFFSVELAAPPATLIIAPPSVCAYAPVTLDLQLTPNGTYVYDWSPAAGLSNASAQDPVASIAHDTWYHVTVSTLTGCAATEDSVFVTVTNGDVLNVEALSQPALICEGEQAQFNVRVQQIIADDDFDNGLGPIWDVVQGGVPNTICGSVAGDALRFNDAGFRFARTLPLDVSAGGVLRFALKIANGTAPCEDVDAGENILVEYSLDGSSWTLMTTYTENQFPDFGSVILPIPSPAQSPNTRFRWRQLLNSGVDQDNWVLDDVAIATDDNSNIIFNWSPPASLSDANIADPIATPLITQTYTVSITDIETGCNYSDELLLQLGPVFTLVSSNDTVLCGSGLGAELSADPVEQGSYTWSWTPNDGTLTTTVQQNTAAFPMQTTAYVVQVANVFGCVVTDTIVVAVVEALNTDVYAVPTTVCAGQAAQLQVQAFLGSGSYSYAWAPPATVNDPNSSTPIATPLTTTTYVVTVSDVQCGTTVQDQLTITVEPAPQPELGDDGVLCPGATLVLNAGQAQQYLWSTNATTPTITVDAPGTYWVNASTGNCVGSDTVNVVLAPDPGELGSTVFGCGTRPAVLTIPYANGTYLWATGDTTQNITVNAIGDYPFTLLDSYGCSYTDVAQRILDPLGLGVIVPNVISPNGDGLNDRFEPQSGGNPAVSVTIFNRFGQELFTSPDLGTLWRGDKDGNAVPAGTYFYLVRYQAACAGDLTEQHGTVTVVR